MRYNISIGYESAESLLIDILTDDYATVCKDISRLEEIEYLEPYQKEDLKHSRKIKKALKRVIKYYSVPGTMNQFFKYYD